MVQKLGRSVEQPPACAPTPTDRRRADCMKASGGRHEKEVGLPGRAPAL